ncbi:MAG: NADH-quinone oxidoreductase subunit N [Gemmataceae bacterium]
MNETLYSQALADLLPRLLPEMVLALTACVVFIGGAWRPNRHLWAWISLGGFSAALGALGYMLCPCHPALTGLKRDIALYATPVFFDDLGALIRFVAYAGGILLLLLSWNEVADRQASDHHACLLLVAAGAGLVGVANDLVMLFVALEMISIPTYIMLYLPRHDDASQEAALKYFLLSVFASAITLFGFSYLYGLAGTTNIPSMVRALNGHGGELPAISSVALIMVVAGMGARITAVPFHFYAPDVYQGAPTSGASLLAFIPKIAGFVALLKLLGFVLPAGIEPRDGYIGMAVSPQTPMFIFFLAAFTMSVGNLLALLQDNLKRILAYSSVAHAGYMLMALAAAPYLRQRGDLGPDGVQALLYYLVAYGSMTIGAFAVIAYLDSRERPVEIVDDVAGLSRSHPVVALVMALFMFSLIGIPLTAGFTGKFLIFFGTMSVPGDQAGFYRTLALIGAINAAIGGWYYLRIVAVMYLRSPLQAPTPKRNTPGILTLAICAALTLGLSVPPLSNWLLKATGSAAGIMSETPARGAAAR